MYKIFYTLGNNNAQTISSLGIVGFYLAVIIKRLVAKSLPSAITEYI